jgi:hypothetical protein
MGSILSLIIEAIERLVEGPMTPEAVERALTAAAAKNSERLDWKNSIVDLLKLLGLDSSLEARKALAKDLGYAGVIDGSAESNIALHAEVMRDLAKRYLKIPGA